MDAASVSSMESFDNENEDKRTQQASHFLLQFCFLCNKMFQVLSSEVQGKVVEAFEVFDHENNKTVDVREVNSLFQKLPKTSRSFLISSEAFVFIAAVYYRPKRKRQAATFSDVEQRCQYLLVCHKSKPGPFAKCDSVFNGQNRTRE